MNWNTQPLRMCPSNWDSFVPLWPSLALNPDLPGVGLPTSGRTRCSCSLLFSGFVGDRDSSCNPGWPSSYVSLPSVGFPDVSAYTQLSSYGLIHPCTCTLLGMTSGRFFFTAIRPCMPISMAPSPGLGLNFILFP